MRIDFIHKPFVYTNTGKRIEIDKIKGTPRVGAELSEDLEVLSANYDPDCVGGVCDWSQDERTGK